MSRPIDIRRIEVIDDTTAAMFRAMTPQKRVSIGLNQHEFAKSVREAGARWMAQHKPQTPPSSGSTGEMRGAGQ